MDKVCYKPIGIIHSPFKEPKEAPVQPSMGKDIEGKVEIFPEYTQGLKGLDGFSHIILICHLHLSKKAPLLLKPHKGERKRGVFATRSPDRPNPIGISVVRLVKIKDNFLFIKDIDMVDGTPLLDIKPYLTSSHHIF